MKEEGNLSSEVHRTTRNINTAKPECRCYMQRKVVIRGLMGTNDTLKFGQLEEGLFRKGLFTEHRCRGR